MNKKYEIKESLDLQLVSLYDNLSEVLQNELITEAEISIFNLRKLLNTILLNSKAKETSTTLKDMLKVLTKMELGSVPLPPIRKLSNKTIEL